VCPPLPAQWAVNLSGDSDTWEWSKVPPTDGASRDPSLPIQTSAAPINVNVINTARPPCDVADCAFRTEPRRRPRPWWVVRSGCPTRRLPPRTPGAQHCTRQHPSAMRAPACTDLRVHEGRPTTLVDVTRDRVHPSVAVQDCDPTLATPHRGPRIAGQGPSVWGSELPSMHVVTFGVLWSTGHQQRSCAAALPHGVDPNHDHPPPQNRRRPHFHR
jgi:hypothetical protein